MIFVRLSGWIDARDAKASADKAHRTVVRKLDEISPGYFPPHFTKVFTRQPSVGDGANGTR
jgi:hypothetical protein